VPGRGGRNHWAAGNYTPTTPSAKFLWGWGDEIVGGGAFNTDLPVNMRSAWFNGPSDLSFFTGASATAGAQQAKANGDAIELIIWLAASQATRDYAISAQFLTDLHTIVQAYNVGAPLYVVLFTELETMYDKSTSAGVAYRTSLFNQYITAADIVRQHGGKAAIGMTGQFWYPGPTRDVTVLEPCFAASDFLASQQMQGALTKDANGDSILIKQMKNCVAQLATYKKPIMLSHFKCWDDPKPITQASMDNAVATFGGIEAKLFDDVSLQTMYNQGLFAINFMSDHYASTPGVVHETLRGIIQGHK
jgi:hypothetical protein